MTPEERAKNTIKEFREMLRVLPSPAQYMQWLEGILTEDFNRAILEERGRWAPKSPEEAKAFVESEIKNNQTIRLAFESKIQSKILEEREACAKIAESYPAELKGSLKMNNPLFAQLVNELMRGFYVCANEIRERSQNCSQSDSGAKEGQSE